MSVYITRSVRDSLGGYYGDDGQAAEKLLADIGDTLASLNRPIRVVMANSLNSGWSESAARECGVDQDEAIENGITIAFESALGTPTSDATQTWEIGAMCFPEPGYEHGDDYMHMRVQLSQTAVPNSDYLYVPINELRDRWYTRGQTGERPFDHAEGFGYKVGEFDANRIALGFDAGSWATWVAYGGSLKPLFDQVVTAYQTDDYFDNVEARRYEAARESFVRLASQANTVRLARLRTEIDEDAAELARLHRQVQTVQSRLTEQQTIYDAAVQSARAASGTSEEVLLRHLDTIERNAHVAAVSLANNRMVVTTDELQLEHPYEPGQFATLGEYAITLDYANNNVEVRNQTNRRGERDHPHVVNGDFCTGGWSSTLRQFMQERDFAAAVAFTLDCLQTVNAEDDWGRSYVRWFRDDESYWEDDE